MHPFTVRFKDSLNAELRWMFDAIGIERRRTEQGTAQGQITTAAAIDHLADVITRTDAEGFVSTFRYDKVGRMTMGRPAAAGEHRD